MMLSVMHKLVAGVLALGAFAPGVAIHAQQTEAEALLAGATALRCTFPMSVRTTWKDGTPNPIIRRTGNLVVNIRNINAASGSAVTPTATVNKDITLVADEKNRFFVDAGGGKVTVTMVLGEFSTGTKFRAAHSVHDYTALDLGSFKSEPDVLQYFGDCEIATPAP